MIFYYQIFALLILNCLVIQGFYKATFFEYANSTFSFTANIIKGSIAQSSAHGVMTRFTESGEHTTLMAASDESIPTLYPSNDFEGEISNIQKVKNIDEDSKMILWKVRYYSDKWFGKFWSKPICTCPVCMSSLHSTYVYFFFLYLNNFDVKLLYFYPIYILALAGVNGTYSSLVKD